MVSRGLDGGPKYGVYRKDTNKENYMHCFSAHEEHVKSGVLTGLALRALRICSVEDLDEEFEHLEMVFSKLGYSRLFVEKCLKKSKKIYYGIKGQKKEIKSCLVVPGVEIACMKKFLPKEISLISGGGIKIAQLVKNREMATNVNSGIYIIGCGDCDMSYIGEFADIKRRLYQHGYALRNKDKNSALVRHEKISNHKFVIEEMSEALMELKDEFKRGLLESMLIRTTVNINNVDVTFDLDQLSGRCVGSSEMFISLLRSFNACKDNWILPGY